MSAALPTHQPSSSPAPGSISSRAASPSSIAHPLRHTPLSSAHGHTPQTGDESLSRAQQLSSSNALPVPDTAAETQGDGQGSGVFGTPPCGVIGKHKPREVVRVARDYTAGESPQFWSGFPFELEGRVAPVQHLNLLNELNALLASANDPFRSIWDNCLAVMTFYASTLCYRSHYQREMRRFSEAIERANHTVYNPVGLNVLDPRRVAMLFLEVEYY